MVVAAASAAGERGWRDEMERLGTLRIGHEAVSAAHPNLADQDDRGPTGAVCRLQLDLRTSQVQPCEGRAQLVARPWSRRERSFVVKRLAHLRSPCRSLIGRPIRPPLSTAPSTRLNPRDPSGAYLGQTLDEFLRTECATASSSTFAITNA